MKTNTFIDFNFNIEDKINRAQNKLKPLVDEADQKNKDMYKMDVFGHETTVLNAMIILYGLIKRSNFNDTLAKYMSESDKLNLAKYMRGVVSKRNTNRPFKRDSIDGAVDPKELRECMTSLTINSVGLLTLSAIPEAEAGFDLRTEIVSRTIVYAVECMNYPLFDIPSVVNIYASIIYFWANKYFDLNRVNNPFKGERLHIENNERIIITEGMELPQFIENVFGTKTGELVKRYITEEFNHTCEYAIYNKIDELVKRMKEVSKENEYLSKVFTHMVNNLSDTSEDQYKDGFKLLNKSRVNDYIALLLVGLINIDPYAINDNFYAPEVYEYWKYYRENKGTDKIDSRKAKDLRAVIKSIHSNLINLVCCNLMIIVGTTYTNLNSSHAQLLRDKENIEKELAKSKTTLANFKSTAKNEKKSISKQKEEINNLTNKVNKLTRELENSITPKDFQSIKDKNNYLKSENDKVNKELENTKRQLSKKNKELEEIRDKLRKNEDKIDELSNKYNRSQEITNKFSINRAYNEIPTQTFVNSIKNRRIAIVGGNMMHYKIHEYGFNNLKLFEAGCRNISYEDISNLELIVICTSYVDHSSIEYIKQANKHHKIPVIQFNNKNVDMLIYEIFKELNK